MSEIVCYSGTTYFTRDTSRRSVDLREALNDYNRECDYCDRMKKEAQEKGLTKVVMSDEHIVEICSA